MNLQMIGIDFHCANMEQREPVSFGKSRIMELLPILAASDHVCACVLLATCNRTELYLHTESPVDALQLLTSAAGISAETYRTLSVSYTNEQMVRHIMEVAAGLKSQIFGDDQIVTQMRTALDLARQAGTTDSILDSLLRRAVTAGKQIRTETRLSGVPSSAAACGVQKALSAFGTLHHKRAVVIGNGEMGRLAATLLYDAGCDVTVTLRTYRHGQTIVPAGCKAYPYQERCVLLDGGADLVFSATTSPHYTLTAAQIHAMRNPPQLLIDLAMPRDIESAAAADPRITLWNLDDLGQLSDENAAERGKAEQILTESCADFYAWYQYRQALPAIASLKDTAAVRIHHDHAYADLVSDCDIDGLVTLAVSKTIDMLLGGMKDIVTPERLTECLQHMKKGGR